MAQTRDGAIKIFCNRIGISTEEYKEKLKSGLKWCTGCKNWVSVDRFNKDRYRYDGLCSKCVDCSRVKEKKNRFGVPSPMKGVKVSEERRMQMSISRKGKPQPWKRKPRTPEERRKISEAVKKVAVRGENNPKWKGGVNAENVVARTTFEYSEWRRSVFERDNYKCQECGYDKGGIIQAHHILGFTENVDLRYDVENGITLCKFCHQLKHTKSENKRQEIIRKRDLNNGKNKD